MTDEIGTKISRRTLAKGAAWTVPVVTVAAAAPAYAASPGDVIVSVACNTVSLLGSVPTFTISVVGSTLEAGSTFILSGAALAHVQLTGTGLQVGALNAGSRTLTTTVDIGPGDSASVAVTDILGAFLLSPLQLSTGTLIGNPNSNTTNDASTVNMTGLGVLGSYTGTCAITNP